MRQTRYDVLIVGSGPVGSTYARTLHEVNPALRVLLVEAGPLIAEPPGRHVRTITDPAAFERAQIASQGPAQYRYDDVRNDTADLVPVSRPGTFLLGPAAKLGGEDGMPAAAMSANVGGMGSHWTCACPRPGDGEQISFIPPAEFDALFRQAWRLLHATPGAFDDNPLGARIRAVLGRQLDAGRAPDRLVQAMPVGLTVSETGARHWTGTDVILGELAVAPRDTFELRPDTVALRLLLRGGTVTGVLLRDRLTGEEYEVTAQACVVACDALRTPQLLHASGVRPAALGHYLNDHPQVLSAVRLGDSFAPTAGSPGPPAPGSVDGFSGVSWIPYDAPSFPFHGQIVQMSASPAPMGEVKEQWPGSVIGLGFFCTKEIQERDRLEFSEAQLDFFGLPQISIHYTLTPGDHAALADAADRITALAESLGGLLDDRAPVSMLPGSSLHYMGTTRMGLADDGTSVCDPSSRVWGTSNLYVGGNGVIPTATACNPTATSVALAVKGARHIAVTHSGR